MEAILCCAQLGKKSIEDILSNKKLQPEFEIIPLGKVLD